MCRRSVECGFRKRFLSRPGPLLPKNRSRVVDSRRSKSRRLVAQALFEILV
jgi:hypothetical protein